jgi:hypothetical protein
MGKKKKTELSAVCDLFQETRRMSRVTTSQECHLNANLTQFFFIKMRFWAEMPSGTCEL